MNKKTQERIQRFQKRMSCDFGGCGEHITITASKDYMENIESEKQVYGARCAKCGASFKLKKTELDFFGRHFGKPQFHVMATTFNTLFDEQ